MANARRCKYCGESTRNFVVYGIMAFCNADHAAKWAYENKSKGANKIKREKDAQHRERKREFKKNDRPWQIKQTQSAFNKMRVLEELLWFAERNLEPTCISCGRELGNDQWCCGHNKTRGAQPGLRFDRNNTFLQHNQRCNMQLSGDIGGTKSTRGYKRGLIERFGEEKGQEIIDYCDRNTSLVKWTCEELEEMRKEFNARAREIRKLLA